MQIWESKYAKYLLLPSDRQRMAYELLGSHVNPHRYDQLDKIRTWETIWRASDIREPEIPNPVVENLESYKAHKNALPYEYSQEVSSCLHDLIGSIKPYMDWRPDEDIDREPVHYDRVYNDDDMEKWEEQVKAKELALLTPILVDLRKLKNALEKYLIKKYDTVEMTRAEQLIKRGYALSIVACVLSVAAIFLVVRDYL